MKSTGRGQKIVLVMVGLPARGKSYTARHLARYLSWLGYPSEVFNVGERRRTVLGATQPHDFFDPKNSEGLAARLALAETVLEDLLEWLASGGRVGIYDATNSTRARREGIRARCEAQGYAVGFVEMVTTDPAVIEHNIGETKLGSPDYAGMDAVRAADDFRKRIQHYAHSYERVGDDEGSYVRITDHGRHFEMHEVDGYVPARIVFFLSNLKVTERPIFLTRHGESLYNFAGRIGGNPGLTAAGEQYAEKLAAYMNGRFGYDQPLDVWTSTLERTKSTAAPLGREISEWPALDEIDAGIRDGLTYEEIRNNWPEEFEARQADKLGYRYPGGESYRDVIQRLDRVIVEIERYHTPVLVVAHQAVLRALYSYFTDVPLDRCPHVDMPLHTIIELAPRAYVWNERRIRLDPASGAVSAGLEAPANA
jgi:broad specificity phosphatase PhoE/predicted kinase